MAGWYPWQQAGATPPQRRRAKMLAVWQAYLEGRQYLLEARKCPAEERSYRPTSYRPIEDSQPKPRQLFACWH